MVHSDYVPLHIHTEYSLLDGAIRIEELIEQAQKFRMPAVAITDHGNLFGAIKFYQKAVSGGIKPIIGSEFYLSPGKRTEKKTLPTGEKAFHLILLSRNLEGYRNLMRLSTRAYTEGFYYKPRIDIELLEQFSGGLIGLSSCLHGEVPFYLSKGQIDKAREAALRYKHILGPENFYLELQNNGIPLQDEVNKRLYELSKELHIPVVATNDCHYMRPEDARAHDILLCIQTGKNINSKDRLRFETDQLYFKSPEEMKHTFREIPEAVLNTRKIAERCNLDLNIGAALLPKYVLPEGRRAEDVLREIALEGLKRKVGLRPPEKYKKRLQYELTVINRMGFAPYFLIVWDFISYARQKNIPVGPGRGSAAGSLVAYCLDITEIDPIRYNLLFERFLNPERISMPDIDVDFCKDRRDEVIKYVANKYGSEHVAHIITFGTMKARAVIRDVGRALDIPYAEVDRIAKMIPPGINVTIEESLKSEKRLHKEYKENKKIRELIDIAKRLEGLCRHASTHAAGVVISPTPLTDYTPLYKNPSEETVSTQYDMKAVETIGLLKFDFLGLKTLTVVEETLRYLKEGGVEFKIKDIALDDEKTYRLLSSGQTIGVFQLESTGMRELLSRLEPSRFEDLIALVALYRPGPLGSGMVDDFIKRKKGQTPVVYDIPELQGILDETYGVILYQEQVMRIAHEIGGFTMAEADVLRKAMGKKLEDKMLAFKDRFVEGAHKRGIKRKKAEELFDKMAQFGKYGFNKSHSAAYAYLAYQTAYLKAHYPVEFMAATLSKEENSDKIVLFINECKRMKIKVLPPDINHSDSRFSVIGDSIRFGLDAVKGIGSAAVQEILQARKKGRFESIEDFLSRIDTRKVNRKVQESLVKAGAFDSLYDDSLPQTIKRAKAMKAISEPEKKSNSLSLFGDEPSKEEEESLLEEWTEEELLAQEKEALGFYITGHPIEKFRPILEIASIRRSTDIESLPDGSEVEAAGIVTSIKKSITKNKEPMAYLTMEDEEGVMHLIAFPDMYKKKADIIIKNNLLVVKGIIDRSEKGTKVILKNINALEEYFNLRRFKVEISLKREDLPQERLIQIRRVLEESKGPAPVYIRLRINGYESLILTEYEITPEPSVIHRLSEFVGLENLRVL